MKDGGFGGANEAYRPLSPELKTHNPCRNIRRRRHVADIVKGTAKAVYCHPDSVSSIAPLFVHHSFVSILHFSTLSVQSEFAQMPSTAISGSVSSSASNSIVPESSISTPLPTVPTPPTPAASSTKAVPPENASVIPLNAPTGTASTGTASTGTASTGTASTGTASTGTASTGTHAVSSAKQSSTATPNLQQHQAAITNGAVAGIGVGCFVAGALITCLGLWIWWSRRRASRPGEYEAGRTHYTPAEKSVSFGGTSLAASPLLGNLPLPLEDKAITGEIAKISNTIKNHVQNYYHTDRLSPGLINYDDIQALGNNNLPISVGTLSTLLGNSATREVALRFCLAWVIVSRVLPKQRPGDSLLPTEVAQCFRKLEIANASSSSELNPTFTPASRLTQTASTQTLARWRVMTADLLRSTHVHDAFSSSDSRHANIQAAMGALENILQPYADSRMNDEHRKRNLEEILKRAAGFALTLFSQPSTWDFDWKEEQGVKSAELCIFPALMQLTDETGEPVRPPQPFSEAVVRRLDG
jgi:hypothetical protein